MTAYHRKPKRTASGKLRYSVGFTDEMGRKRTKGGFRSRKGSGGTNQWLSGYLGAEAQGREALRLFLDDRLAGRSPAQGESLDQTVALWLAASDPSLPGGLAKSTWKSYRECYARHIRPTLGSVPIKEFERPTHAAELRDRLSSAGAGARTSKLTLAVLSAALSWATETGRIEANGVKLLAPRRRRSTRASGGKASSSAPERAAKALSASAAAAVVRELLTAPSVSPLIRRRDATIAALQFLTGCRNQDLYGLRWGDITDRNICFENVVSSGELTEGKVGHSRRRFPMNDVINEWMSLWRAELSKAKLPHGETDFIFAGDAPEGHRSENQTKKWTTRRFKPAAKRAAAAATDKSYLSAASPYSLRRGHISVRMRRGDDAVRVAIECGTSVQMIYKHYMREIEEANAAGKPLHDQFADAWKRPEPRFSAALAPKR